MESVVETDTNETTSETTPETNQKMSVKQYMDKMKMMTKAALSASNKSKNNHSIATTKEFTETTETPHQIQPCPQSFSVKYRPTKLTDFELDSDIMQLLNTLIEMDSVNILINGNCCSGKTSIITALVSAILKKHNVDVDKWKQNTNQVLYINNLQEQGILYYRTFVKTFCQTKSSLHHCKKILILDDIDAINDNNQQAFRTCMDEYKHNVHFICSCTDTNKVIDSIQSRLSIVKLRPLSYANMENIYDKITRQENLTGRISEAGKRLLIQSSNYSPRILVNYLEKIHILRLESQIDETNIPDICTIIHNSIFDEFSKAVFVDKNIQQGIKILFSICDNGYSVMDILDNYFIYIKTLHQQNNKDIDKDKYIMSEKLIHQIIPVICKYIVIFHTIHEADAELALFVNNLVHLPQE